MPNEAIDQIRVLSRLRSVTHDIALLRTESTAGGKRRGDPIWARGVSYAFVTSVGSCADVAQHLCAVEQWGPPADDGAAFALLGTHGVLPEQVATAMGEAAELRDALVHQQVDVDAALLERLLDTHPVESCVAAVAEFVEQRY